MASDPAPLGSAPPGTGRPNARKMVGAIAASVSAAFLWATYYLFVLLLPGVGDVVVTVVPFAAGGTCFLLLLAAQGSPPREWTVGWLTPGTLLRAGLLLFLQLDVVLATRSAGAVDTSLATLLGDVVVTPLLVALSLGTGSERLRWRTFQGGLALSSAGAVIAIVGGRTLGGLGPGPVLLLLPLPFLVAGYFVVVARAQETEPMPRLVSQATLTAAAMGVLLLPFFPLGGTSPGVSPVEAALLLVALGVTSFFLAPWAYFAAAARLTLVVPAVLQALIPVFTLLLVVLFALAPTSEFAWVGVPIAFAGSVLAVWDPRRRSPAALPGPRSG